MRQTHLTVLCLDKVHTVKQNRPFLTHAQWGDHWDCWDKTVRASDPLVNAMGHLGPLGLLGQNGTCK